MKFTKKEMYYTRHRQASMVTQVIDIIILTFKLVLTGSNRCQSMNYISWEFLALSLFFQAKIYFLVEETIKYDLDFGRLKRLMLLVLFINIQLFREFPAGIQHHLQDSFSATVP